MEKNDVELSRWSRKVEKLACKKAYQYLWQKFKAMRANAMRSSNKRCFQKSRTQWMSMTWMCVNNGGILPFYRDEVLPTNLCGMSLWDYKPFIEQYIGEESDKKLMSFYEEAASDVPSPKIIDGSIPNNFMAELPAFLKNRDHRTKINTAGWII